MPDTGRRLAGELGLASFDPDDLFVPATNLELGAYYLSQLLRRFDGRVSAAVASYNAGAAAVSRWVREGDATEDDTWVEAIPYDQTRKYVKRVLRSVHAYRVLY
jgi:soluble lytic murein transglycosylase